MIAHEQGVAAQTRAADDEPRVGGGFPEKPTSHRLASSKRSPGFPPGSTAEPPPPFGVSARPRRNAEAERPPEPPRPRGRARWLPSAGARRRPRRPRRRDPPAAAPPGEEAARRDARRGRARTHRIATPSVSFSFSDEWVSSSSHAARRAAQEDASHDARSARPRDQHDVRSTCVPAAPSAARTPGVAARKPRERRLRIKTPSPASPRAAPDPAAALGAEPERLEHRGLHPSGAPVSRETGTFSTFSTFSRLVFVETSTETSSSFVTETRSARPDPDPDPDPDPSAPAAQRAPPDGVPPGRDRARRPPSRPPPRTRRACVGRAQARRGGARVCARARARQARAAKAPRSARDATRRIKRRRLFDSRHRRASRGYRYLYASRTPFSSEAEPRAGTAGAIARAWARGRNRSSPPGRDDSNRLDSSL